MSLPRTKERWLLSLPSKPWSKSNTNWAGGVSTTQGISTPVYVKQTTTSQGNPWKGRQRTGTFKDIGSNFETNRQSYSPGSGGPEFLRHKIYGNSTEEIHGALWAPAQPPTQAVFDALRNQMQLSSMLTLHGMGATAIARTTPTNPAVDMMTFVGELRKEGIPKVLNAQNWSRKVPVSKKASDEYLAWQFGAVPFVGDLLDLADTVRHQDKILAQYERDSGRNVRRKYEFEPIRSGSTQVSRGIHPYHPAPWNPYLVNAGRLDIETEKVRRVWFSGCYTYYLTLPKDTRSRLERTAQEAKRLYGVRVTPDVLWNLTPWTWAADWMANGGDVIQNLSSFSQDGLVLRYGYVMEESSITVTRRFKSDPGLDPVNLNLADSYSLTRKIRWRATPYGFGLDPDGFTAKQVSILAALGLSTRGQKYQG
jgi:hypothetical protein